MENNKKIILGIIGEISAGKDTLAEYLKLKHNATHYRFSEPLRDILVRLHIEINRHNLQNLSTMLRQLFGQNVLAKTICEDFKNGVNMAVITGIRRPGDVDYFFNMPNFKLLYVTADIKIRYSRMLRRKENNDDNYKTFEEFIEDNKAEAELQIPLVSQKADFTIDNSGTLEELYIKIDQIITNLLK